jgi:hypothetical protein
MFTKYPKYLTNIPMGHKIVLSKALKNYRNCFFFWLENKPSGNPAGIEREIITGNFIILELWMKFHPETTSKDYLTIMDSIIWPNAIKKAMTTTSYNKLKFNTK